ncbi:hypothetical protein BZL39_H04980 [Zygosaccharomyces parabailii]|nr:hypothetical protein BZL39_H04980 [Zygosaccharomyces parabailii]CDH13985.1 related to Endo-1,3(4)-beta-glucanase 1 [Zygosaccharomyces bailii ISA1307]
MVIVKPAILLFQLLSLTACTRSLEVALETDIILSSSNTILTAGDPYITADYVVSRVSATAESSLSLLSVAGSSEELTTEFAASDVIFTSESVPSLGSSPATIITSGSVLRMSTGGTIVNVLSSKYGRTTLQPSSVVSNILTVPYDSDATTSTSTIFTTSMPFNVSQTSGSILTSLTSKSNPLVTNLPSFSSQKITINTNTLTSAVTVSNSAVSIGPSIISSNTSKLISTQTTGRSPSLAPSGTVNSASYLVSTGNSRSANWTQSPYDSDTLFHPTVTQNSKQTGASSVSSYELSGHSNQDTSIGSSTSVWSTSAVNLTSHVTISPNYNQTTSSQTVADGSTVSSKRATGVATGGSVSFNSSRKQTSDLLWSTSSPNLTRTSGSSSTIKEGSTAATINNGTSLMGTSNSVQSTSSSYTSQLPYATPSPNFNQSATLSSIASQNSTATSRSNSTKSIASTNSFWSISSSHTSQLQPLTSTSNSNQFSASPSTISYANESTASSTISYGSARASNRNTTTLVGTSGSISSESTLRSQLTSASLLPSSTSSTKQSLHSPVFCSSSLFSSSQTFSESGSSSTASSWTSTTPTSVQQTTATAETSTSSTISLFDAIATDEPPSVFGRSINPLSPADGVSNDGPIETNKFYTNLLIGTQGSAVFVYPYSLWKYSSSYGTGFAVQHTTSSQYSFGDDDSEGNSEYLVNPLGIAHCILSATSFDSSMTMEIDEMTFSSVKVKLAEGSSTSDYLEIPLVQGMGFSTGVYHGGLIAKIASSVGFSAVTEESSTNLPEGVLKYRIALLNGVTWLCYVVNPSGTMESSFSMEVTSTYTIEAADSIDGLIIQLAVAPESTDLDKFYDEAAGMYPTDFQVSGISDGTTATYEFSYNTEGSSASGNTIIFSLPHHQKSFTSSMADQYTGITLQSTTKGVMAGYLTNVLQFSQTINTEISWLPWSSQLGSDPLSYSADQLKLLAEVANSELQVSVSDSISGLNTYYLGKVIDKYAYILLTVSDIIGDESSTSSTLENLKSAFDILLGNSQTYPLIYDTRYGGIVSSGDWASTTTQYDFGNTYYNDHHFHYGYIIHAAAAIGHVDAKLGGTWAQENKEWVNSLVRDVANPSTDDQYFAQSRMFDWFHGHSWAAGLFENGNGKNEESSSEDYNFAYGMKLWGSVIGDSSMELRGDLMISIMSDSMNDYMLYDDSNTVEPSEIIGNKVSGILFDDIIDYTTYFGTNTEYIHGIHMLPITPASSAIRQPTFVSQEWSSKLSSIIGSLESGWAGILRLNQALFDPLDSYNFFSASDFDSSIYLDDGMSRTWALAFSGGLANSLGLM